MKTKRQIQHFLTRRKYKSEIDFDGISLYCSKKFKIKLHRPSAYYPEPSTEDYPLSYADFAWWLENGFGAGDVVEWDGNIGLVQSGDINKVEICVRIDRNGPNFNPIIITGQSIHLAKDNALERIYEVLQEYNKEFGNPFFRLTEKFIPNPNTIVTFKNHKTGIEGTGVVRLIDKDGSVIMYCLHIKGSPIRYSMNEILGNVSDFMFTQVGTSDYPRKALESALAKVGKSWNHSLRRIEPLNMKVEKGQQYYYITDQMSVVCGIEKGTPTSHKRYLAGNYFKNQKDALRILEGENELRRKFLAEPESDL